MHQPDPCSVRFRDIIVDGSTKGFPGQSPALSIAEIATQGWNVVKQDLPFPVALLKDSALRHNRRQMSAYLKSNGAFLCPHGKTTMSPRLFREQLADDAWGLSAATTTHVKVYKDHGVQRIFFTNQLAGLKNVEFIFDELQKDDGFQFYCLVDSLRLLDYLELIMEQHSTARPLNVLIEVGAEGGRCGVRTVGQGKSLADEIANRPQKFSLAGVEAFEGIFSEKHGNRPDDIDKLLQRVVDLAEYCDKHNYFRGPDVLLSAGGSIYFDRAVQSFRRARMSAEPTIIIRSGCYLTHDHGYYDRSVDQERHNSAVGYPVLQPAIEVWACVQSVPEPGLAVLGLGKRDISHDAGMPKPLYVLQDGKVISIQETGFEILSLYDQHAILRCPRGVPIDIGQPVGLGVSHPCTTFDKWRLLYLVDDEYNVLEGIQTYF